MICFVRLLTLLLPPSNETFMDWLAFIYWNVSPDLVWLGPFRVRWYGLLFVAGFLVGYRIMRGIFQRERKPVGDLESLLVYLVVGTLIGARLGEVFFYAPDYYFRHPLEIVAVWHGGLASHGGVVGVLMALALYTRKHPDQPYLWLLDRLVVPGALAGCFIRLGNLMNSEILGTPTHAPWAFVFARVDNVPRHPVQLYEATAYLLIFLALGWIYRRQGVALPRGRLFGLFLTSVFTFRFVIEFWKEHQADYAHQLPLHTGQWLSIPFVIVGLGLLWRVGHPSLRNPS